MEKIKNFKDIKILSVDDDGFNQELASAVFIEYNNLEILQAYNGKEAIEVLEKEPIDIILLDLLMPEMNGFETLKYLKANSDYKHIPVIVVTSKEDEKRTTYKMGANDFLTKPYSPEELKLRVLNHLSITRFGSLFKEIEEESGRESYSENESHLAKIQEAIEIAISSQKKLLAKLRTISNEEHNEKSSQRMGEYAKVMGKLCGMNSKDIDNLYYCMFIYDIGLLRVDKAHRAIQESKEFEKYPELGISIIDDLENTRLLKMAKEIIYSHREEWNGKGYPQKLKEDAIPLYAQITAIINMYDELTTSRVYATDIISSENALDIIKRERNNKFSPLIVDLFSENFEQFKIIKNRLT